MAEQSSGIYYALFKRSGKQIRRSLKTTDKALARGRLEELRNQVGRLKVGIKDLTFREFAEKWLLSLKGGNLKPKAYQRRQSSLNGLLPYFGSLNVRNITPAHCDAWKGKRGVEVKAQTFNIDRETLRMVFRYVSRSTSNVPGVTSRKVFTGWTRKLFHANVLRNRIGRIALPRIHLGKSNG